MSVGLALRKVVPSQKIIKESQKRKNDLCRGIKTRVKTRMKIEMKIMGWNEFTTTKKTKGRIVNKK